MQGIPGSYAGKYNLYALCKILRINKSDKLVILCSILAYFCVLFHRGMDIAFIIIFIIIMIIIIIN